MFELLFEIVACRAHCVFFQKQNNEDEDDGEEEDDGVEEAAGDGVGGWEDNEPEEAEEVQEEDVFNHTDEWGAEAAAIAEAPGEGQLVGERQRGRRQQRNVANVAPPPASPAAPPRTWRPCGVCKTMPEDSCNVSFQWFEVARAPFS